MAFPAHGEFESNLNSPLTDEERVFLDDGRHVPFLSGTEECVTKIPADNSAATARTVRR
jgi:hypothetical protein